MNPIMTQHRERDTVEDEEPLTLWQVICSVFAAGFGVQSRDNKVRDFSRGKPLQFIIAGVLFTAAFMLSLIVVINIIL